MKFDVNGRERAFIIAEAGTCHADPSPNRRTDHARRYVDEAARVGADAIKFQMFHRPGPDSMFCWLDGDEARSARWHASALTLDDWHQIKEFAEASGIMFLASTFEAETVRWLGRLGVAATKVASRAAMSFPYGEAPEPYLVSLGMGCPDQVPGDAIYLECEARYPSTLRWSGDHSATDMPGFSDHSGTPWRAIDAISRGCALIEVHFFIKPVHAGPDRPASLSPVELKLVCDARDSFADLNQKESR
jgi:sialic acid synthase SpsE